MRDVRQRFGVVVDDRRTPTLEGRIISSMHRAANLARSRRALVLILVAGCAATITRPANATPPVPFYASRVTEIDRQSPGAVLITTKDSVATVCAWYRLNLHDQNGEKVTDDGAHIFYTHSGATVDVDLATSLYRIPASA